MFHEHPEWTNGLGQWAYLDEGTVWRVVLGNPQARDWMIETLVRVIDETKIDWFLTDHWLLGPTRADAHDLRATDDYLSIAEGLDVVIDRIREARPHVMIEHCDNGIAFPTFRMTRQYVTSIGPDAVGSLYERVGAYRLSRVLPPRFLDSYVSERLAPHIPFDGEFGDYEYRSHMFGGPMILMTDIMAIAEGSDAWNALQRSIGLFRKNRRHIADGKVLHLLDPQPFEQVNGDWDGWDAIGSYLPATDSAIVMTFRLGGDTDARRIPIHGLNPATTYRVTFEDRPDALEIGGATLMQHGLDLTLPAPGGDRNIDGLGFVRASEVIYLNPVERPT
jgi:alpha-galactosidase